MLRIHSDKTSGEKYVKKQVERRFVCTYCSKKFPTMDSLVIHTRTHTGEKPFFCEVCGKRFTQKAHLLLHTRTHSGEKPFSCQICFKRFSTKHELITHTRSHTGEKPFLCEYCSKSFGLQTNLLKHKKIYHTEKYLAAKEETKKRNASVIQEVVVKPVFPCTDCTKTFSLESDLVSHAKAHEVIKAFIEAENLKKLLKKKKAVPGSKKAVLDGADLKTELIDAGGEAAPNPSNKNWVPDVKKEIPESFEVLDDPFDYACGKFNIFYLICFVFFLNIKCINIP